ncbi:DUF6868 family protein [Spongiibacter sp.]|uniref:DUF6868 family protein n=1 Tax=Spongiibacter sp. TaxID=2024860 RepID=UPI00356282C4
MSLLALEALLYYCCLINGGLLLVSSALLLLAPPQLLRYQSRLLHIPVPRLRLLYAQWLAQFKVLFIFFNLSPWLALKLLS